MKKLDLSINQYNINGIIQFGSNTGELSNYYHSIGVHKVLWIDKTSENYSSLYDTTRKFGMEQNYAFFDTSIIAFKEWWRKNVSWCDIESYDMIYLSQTENQKKTISGFENLLGTIKLVYFANGIENDCHIFLLENGYQIYEYKTSNTNHVYGECYYLKKS